MNLSLSSAYDATDVSGRVHEANTALSATVHDATTWVSSIGQNAQRPASMARRWAPRVVAAAAVYILPGAPFLALAASAGGSLAVAMFGVGRDKNRPPQSNPVKHIFELIRAHGVVGLPEHGACHLANAAKNNGHPRLFQFFMGVAIVLGAIAQVWRVPMAVLATFVLLTDGAAQLLAALAAAALGIISERYHNRGVQADVQAV